MPNCLHCMGPLAHHHVGGMVTVYYGIGERESKVVFGEEGAKDGMLHNFSRELYEQKGVWGLA